MKKERGIERMILILFAMILTLILTFMLGGVALALGLDARVGLGVAATIVAGAAAVGLYRAYQVKKLREALERELEKL